MKKTRAAAALLPLALAACAPSAPGTRFLNLDAESTRTELASGWSGFERTGSGDTFAWAQAREARVVLLAEGPADRLVRFRAWPFRWEGAPPQTVAVVLNGVRLGAVPLADGPGVYALPSPGPAWKKGENVLSFEFAYAEAPRDRVPGVADARTLAAAFDWIEVLPLASAPLPGT